ncbi:MAG: antitoxin Xre/MbcA/ParS toxin-binding domain-containing protein [Spirochaetota bacterium]
MSYQAVLKELGLKILIGTPLEFIKAARNGIPKKSIDALAKKMNLQVSDIARCLHVSERTLQRYEPDKVLSPDLSDHVLQITRVYTRCLEVFEDKKDAAQWLKEPCASFGNVPPVELLDTSTGIEMIFDELVRIEYGAVS